MYKAKLFNKALEAIHSVSCTKSDIYLKHMC